LKQGLNRFTMKNFNCHQLTHATLWPLAAESFIGMYPVTAPTASRIIGRGNGKESDTHQGVDG